MTKSDWPDWHCPNHTKRLKKEGKVLTCPGGDQFPIRNGVPRFVTTSYADAFGPEAKKYRTTQFDSYSGTTITRDRARQCVGEDLGRGACVTSIDITEAVDSN